MISRSLCSLLLALPLAVLAGTVRAEPTCVSGVVRSAGQVVPNARLKLVSADREIVTFSQLDGSYRVCADPGSYRLEAQYRSDRFEAAINLAESERRDIELGQ